MSMSLYKHRRSWWFRFRDHKGKQRRIRAGLDKRTAEFFSGNVSILVDARASGRAISDDIMRWFDMIDEKRQKTLIDMGLVDRNRLAASQPLATLLDIWHKDLTNRGLDEAEARKRYARAKAVIDACEWEDWLQIDPDKVLGCIQDWRDAGAVPGFNRSTAVSERTLGHYLASIRQFTRWMVDTDKAHKNPLRTVAVKTRKPAADVEVSNMAKRRALGFDEQDRLLAATLTQPTRWKMPADQRYLLYSLALETGLRASAIRRLTPADVLGNGWLNAKSGGAKNKKTTPKPIRSDLLELLQAHIAGREDDGPLLDWPQDLYWAQMLRQDCEAAGIDTEGVDFHALRHTYGTSLASLGVHPKTLMHLMDHTDINMTMKLYTHSKPEDEIAAIDKLHNPRRTTEHQSAHQKAV